MNPRDPQNVLVAWIQDGRATDLVMASRDGGRSFSRILVPGLSYCTGGALKVASDPGVYFSADGRIAYFSAIVVDFTSPTDVESASTSMLVSRSVDGGFSWSVPTVVQPVTGDFWDLPNLTPDPRQPKRAYFYYVKRLRPDFAHGQSMLSITTDGGRTWSKPRVLYDPKTSDSWPSRGKILVNRDGSLLNVFALVGSDPNPDPNAVRSLPTQELALRSVDGGRTWSKPIMIGHTDGRDVHDPVTGQGMNIYDTFPAETIAPNGDVYATWSQPGAMSSRIVVARSQNGGRTWSSHYLGVRGQSALPTVEVAGDGTVGVTYYKASAASSGGFWPTQVILANSRDQGRTWSHQPIAGQFNLLAAGSKARPCCFVGDYEGIARLQNGLVATTAMSKPLAKYKVDVFFSRITTSSK
ncbi:MAG TPA: sialidase family protein [Acidimicrobiales bacterium]|nr:sialidase family protein [Acidimicrobiales bacterium]